VAETPGVFVEELGSGHGITGVATLAGFVGFAEDGPLDQARTVTSWADYERYFGGPEAGELGYAVRSFFENGGREASIVRVPDGGGAAALLGEAAAGTGLYALGAEVNLFSLPDIAALPADAYASLATAAAGFCAERNAFLILDPPSGLTSVADAGSWVRDLTSTLGETAMYAAAYWPPLLVPGTNGQRAIAPSGAVAGIYVRTEERRGIWKAAAGIADGALSGVTGLTYTMTDDENGVINPLGLNALRHMPSYGSVVWGARTLAGADELGSDYKYAPVRRLASFIEASLLRGLQWVVFEPNDPVLWSSIRVQVDSFLTGLWRQGAFLGAKASEAFFAACDATTTTPDDVEAGIVNVTIGIAPLRPAEFVVLQIQLTAAPPPGD
jgi:uncharacterized protein